MGNHLEKSTDQVPKMSKKNSYSPRGAHSSGAPSLSVDELTKVSRAWKPVSLHPDDAEVRGLYAPTNPGKINIS